MIRAMVTRETRITLPVVTPQIFENYVTFESPRKIREAVRKIAGYFRREGDYDFVQYDVGDNTKHETYVFHRQTISRRSCRYGSEVFGAACFRWRNDWEDFTPRWCLQWIWLHPYIFVARGTCKRFGHSFLKDMEKTFFQKRPIQMP